MELDDNTIHRLNHLIQVCEESAKRFYNAAEHIRNRGLKLILKSYVQQRVRFANELRSIVNRVGEAVNRTEPVGEALSRGWTDIKATMTVRRQGRQELVLAELAGEEAKTLTQYGEALNEPLPPAIHTLIERQLAEIRRIQRRLVFLAEESDQHILVRLFNESSKAEQVIQQLKRAGFAADDIDTASVEQLDIYTGDARQERRTMRDTVLTSVLIGLGFGALLGLLFAFAQRYYFPEWNGLFTSTPLGIVLEGIAGGALVGAFFGLIFGLFMGRDAVEDDSYLSTQSLRHGDTIVAVFTDPPHIAEAERIIGLHHQFEVEPAAA
jgi:uncharacterized protein (TIGR02284 family)